RGLEVAEDATAEQSRCNVDLDVELRELGLEVRVADRLEHARVDERRVARLVGEVELDLQPERAPLVLEARLRQHAREDVEARPDLLPVTLPVLAAEGARGDLLPHARSVPAGLAREAGGPRHGGCGLRGATAGAARYAPASESTSGCTGPAPFARSCAPAVVRGQPEHRTS